MRPVEIIRALQSTNSRTEKEAIIKNAWLANSVEFFQGTLLAYNILITFGVQRVAEIQSDGIEDESHSSFGWPKFENLARKLSNRTLTGHAARDAINAAAEEANIADWNEWYRRILLKDLRAGITETTINKVLKSIGGAASQYIIPEFGCQLAKDGTDHPDRMRGRKYLDPKLDGVRILTVVDKTNNMIRQFTRNGKENTNFQPIIEKLMGIIEHIPGNLVLDGEMVSNSFQALMTQVNRKEEINTSDAKLALFDIIPLDDFVAGRCDIPQNKRHEVLSSMTGLFQEKCGTSVYILPKLLVDLDTVEGKQALREFNDETLKAGLEGIMIKDISAPYEAKRSFAWMKAKPFITLDIEVIGYEEGTGKNAGRLGNLLCNGFSEDKMIVVSVGSGFSDAQRTEFWQNRDLIVGRIIEVEAEKDLTKAQNREDVWSLRFPRFVRLRDLGVGQGKI
jgi:DNA ligase-1